MGLIALGEEATSSRASREAIRKVRSDLTGVAEGRPPSYPCRPPQAPLSPVDWGWLRSQRPGLLVVEEREVAQVEEGMHQQVGQWVLLGLVMPMR